VTIDGGIDPNPLARTDPTVDLTVGKAAGSSLFSRNNAVIGPENGRLRFASHGWLPYCLLATVGRELA